MTTSSETGIKAWPQGFAINPRGKGPSPEMIEAYRDTPVAWISDCLGRSVGSVGLNYYHGDVSLMMIGTAFTVRVRPGDNLMIHKAIELAQPGDVIVVDAGGDCSQALIGNNMRTSAIRAKIAGFVLDGALRDLAELADGKLPCTPRASLIAGQAKTDRERSTCRSRAPAWWCIRAI